MNVNKDNKLIMAEFLLFTDQKNIEKNKTNLHRLWKERGRRIETFLEIKQ